MAAALVESDLAFTAAFAGQLALDETQYQDGFGPASRSPSRQEPSPSPTWRQRPLASMRPVKPLAAGVHSSLSVALPLQEAVLSALNPAPG